MARKDEDKKKKKQYTTNISEAKRNTNGDIVSPYKGSKKTSYNKEYTTNIAEAKRDSDGNLVSPYKTSSSSSSPQETFNKPQTKQTSDEAYNKYRQYKAENSGTPRNSVEEEVEYANSQLNNLSEDEKKSLDKVTTANKVLSALQGLGSVTTRDNPFGVQNQLQSEAIEQKKQGEEEFKSKTGVDDQAYQKYVQYAREVQNAEDRKQRQEQIKKDTTGGNKVSNAIAKGTLDVADLVVSPWAGLSATAEGTLGRLGYADQNAPVDTNSANYMMQNFTTDVEKNRTDLYNEEGGIVDNTIGKWTNKDLGTVDSFLYGTGMSMGKAAISMAMGGEIAGALGVTGKAANAVANLVTLPQFGTSSYATTLQQAQERGLSQKQAQATAIVSGAAEMVFEKLSVDHFWDIYKNSGAKAARNAIVNILAQAGIEGSEEVTTDIANEIADRIINKGQSEYEQNVKEYGKDKANKMFFAQLGQDFLGGAISGAVFGGFGVSANHHQAAQYSNAELGVEKDGKAVYTGQEVADKYAQIRDAIPEIGATNGQTKVASELKQTADLLRIKAQNNQDISQKERNSFYQMQSFLGEQYEADENYRKIVDEYKKSKVEDNKAQGFANFNQITNEIMTQKVTNPEMSEEAQVETELKELSPMDNMLVEESEGKSPAYISGVKGEEFAPSNIDEEIAYNEGQQYRTQRKSEENNPKTATAIRGNEKFKIASIKNVNGEPYITTDSGVTMPLSEASIVNDNVQTLYNNASKHDNAQAYIDGYNPNIPVKAYSSAMENVYNYARLHGAKGTFENAIKNEPYKDKIDKASLKAMYEEGLKDTQTKSKKVTKSGKKAQGKVTDENNRLSKNGRKLMKAISDKLGVDVEIVDNQMTVDGKTVNGFFDVDNNKIVLNAEGQNVFKTLIHEVMGEMSEAYSSEKMDELQLAIIDYELAHNPKKFNDTVENYRQAYIKHEGAKSYREAADEYVNDILVELFNDEQGMKDFANFISDKQSVKETFLEFIDNIVSAIKELMGDNTNSRFKDDIEAMQRLRKMALDTWQTAIDNKLALENGETELKQASSLDVRNSINVDTEGRELNDSQKTFFKNSKIVDEDGKLLVLYHGTPVGGFNEFRNPLNFFTPNKAYAERYANQDSKTGEIYEVYLNVEKPFDITNPEDRQIFIDEYVKGGWSYSIDPSLSDKEIAARIKDGIDWTEADNLKEFLEENDYDYDGLILNEGGDFEYGDRDNSYVIFESRQAKRVDNENPTKDADIRFSLNVPEEESKTLIAIHNLSAEQMLKNINLGGFPMPSIAVTTTELGHTDYGDVSVLFGKDTIDPAKSRKNKIYGGDAWTPTVPRLESKINEKVAEKMRKKIYGLVDTDEQHALGFVGLDNENMENEINNRRGDVIEANRDKRLLKYAFLKDNGIGLDIPQTDKRLSNKFDNDQVLAGTKVVKDLKQAEDLRMNTRSYENHPEIVEGLRQALNEHFRQKHADALKGTKLAEKDLYDELSYSDFDQLTVGLYKYYRDGITQEMDSSAMRDAIDEKMEGREEEYDKWLHELFDGIVEKQGLRNNKELFTYSGNRRSWESLHDEYNLDNIVKLMGQQDAKGEAGFFSVSKIQALATKNFKNLSEVRKAKNQLRMETEEEREARVDEQSQRFSEICQEIGDKRESNPFIAVGRASDAIADAVSKYHTVQGIDRELREWTGLNIQDDTAQKIVDLMKDIAENPTGYFEAKPQRAVELSEIERVIVPHLEKDLMAALEEKNIPYTTYKAGDDEARKAAVNSVPEIRFSIEVDSEGNKLSREQQRYFADSKVVDDQGRLKVMYHGTERADFTVFDPEYADDGISLFFTDNETVAKGYSGTKDKVKFNYTLEDLNKMVGGYEDIVKEGDTYRLREYIPAKDDYKTIFEGTFDEMKDYVIEWYGEVGSGNYEVYLNVTNPYVVDANGSYWDELPHGKDTWTTRDYADYAKKNGYDGLIVNNVIDTAVYASNMEKFEPSQIVVAFDSNQVKSIENKTPTKDADIRYSVNVETLDSDYKDAVEKGNKEEAKRLIQVAADQAYPDTKGRYEDGTIREFYHGTNSDEFNEFDSKMIGTANDSGYFGRGFYFAFNKGEARMYGSNVIPAYLNTVNPYYISDLYKWNGKDVRDFEGDFNDIAFAMNFAREFPEYASDIKFAIYDEDGSPIDYSFEQFEKDVNEIANNKKFVVSEKQGDYGTYYEVETDKQSENGYEWYDYSKAYADEGSANDEILRAYHYLLETKYNDTFVTRPRTIIMDHPLSETLQQRGYDSIYQSENGDEVVVFNSSQIGRSDITYDDNGNLIPPSERFNTDNGDIRYSLDVDYQKAYEEGNTEEMDRLVRIAAEENGYDSPKLYHGTDAFGFTQFDLDKMDDKQSIFLTNNPKIASTYAGDTAFWEGGAVGSYGESRLRTINESIPGDVFKMSMEEVADNLNKIKSNKKAGRTFRAYNRKQLEADRPKILKDIKDASNSIKSIDTSRFNNNEKESYKTLRDIINNNSVDEIYDKAHVFRDFYMNLLSLMEQDDNISRIGTELYSYGLLQKVNRPFSDDVVALLYDGVVSEVLEPYMARKRLKQATKEAIYSLYAKLGNSLVIDGKGRYWNHIKGWSNLENEPTKTRDIADYAKKNGYDSVIFKNLKDNGGRNDGNVDYDETADIYVIFNPNDIKSADTVTYDEDGNVIPLSERFNPENPDIRFSIEVDDKISDIKKRAEKRFSFDQADLDLLDSLAEGQNYNKVADDTMAQILSSINNLYKGQEVGAKSIQTVAKEIKEYTGSTISTSKLEEQLKTLFDYMQRADNELNTGEMFDMFKIVAGDVVDKMASKKVDDSFRDFMRTETFRLTDDQKKEVAHVFGSYENFRKKYYGTLKIRNDATSTLDGLWNEITEQSFYGLDKDTPEAEQPIALVDFLDAMKDQPINNFGASFDELSTDVAIRILEKYFAAEQEAMTNKALLDNPSAKKALDDARANMRKADQEFRKQVKEKYDEEVARLTKERDDAQSSSQFFYNRARDLENKLANASNEEDKKAIRKLQSELEKKEKALIKAKAQSKAPLSAYQEQLGRADEKRKIMQISNRLMKMVYAPTEKLHMPEEFREPIGEFLNGIDFITHRGDLNSIDKMRWQTRMDNLRHYLSELSSKPNATQSELNLAELLEDELLEDMEKFTRDHAEDKKISRMSKDDLHKLYGILTRLSATVSKTNETFANSVYADMTKLNVDSYNELVEMNDRNVGNGVMQSIKDFFSKTLEDPVTYFSLLGKAPKTLFDGLLKGFDRRTGHIKEAQEYMNFLPKDAYKWEKQKHTFVINGTYDVKGEELELTTTQIMTLYELNKRKAASHHLFSGGIKALNTHLLGYTSQSRKAYHLTEADLRNIFGVLTTEQIEAADKMQEFMANNCADWGNNVSMTLWGYKKFTEKDYFPMKVDSDSRATSNKDNNVPNFYSNKNISASKELKEMADNPLLIGDIFDVFTEHVADMATYDGMVLPQMDAMRWFNYKVKEVDGQGRNFISGTKQEINRIYGQAGLSYFTNLMLGINGAEPKARGVRLQNALIGRYKKVAVTAKIRVAIQQPTAFVRAYDEMDGKYLTKALATTNPVKYSKIAKQNSNLAWWKGQGYYESYLGKGLKEIIVGKNPVIQKVEDFEGWGAQTMDDLTWGILYHASELEVKDKHPDLKGKEFTDAVVERFEDLVSKTQVVDTMLHRTDIMRSQGDLTKLATSFMTEPLKTYNMLMRSVVGAARDKDKKALRKLIRTLFVYVANAAILSMVTTTWDALRKDDDETKYTDKWLELYGQEAVDNLNPLQMIPFVKDVVDIVNAKLTGEYRNATDMTYEGITKAAQFVAHMGKKITGENLTVSDYGLAKEGVQALSILSGVPVYNIWNDIEGIHNGFFDNWETKVQSPYKDFYKAIDNDEDITDAVNNLHEAGKEDKYIKSQITSHYKPIYLETTDMTEKANLKNKLIKAYTAAGDTREQAIKKIDKW